MNDRYFTDDKITVVLRDLQTVGSAPTSKVSLLEYEAPLLIEQLRAERDEARAEVTALKCYRLLTEKDLSEARAQLKAQSETIETLNEAVTRWMDRANGRSAEC